jgi:two-component system, LytTR family, response regulator LytT
MKIHQCLIIEDSEDTILFLKDYLHRLTFFDTDVSQSFEDAYKQLTTKKFDLIFLGTPLKNKLGLDLLRIIPNLAPVIVISAYSEYAIESYEYDMVVDYIMKPASIQRIERAIAKALGRNISDMLVDKNFIFLKVGRKILRFDYTNIEHIEAFGVYSKICNNGQVTLVNEPIYNLEKILPKNTFRRVHKSYIINLHKIKGFDHKKFYIGNIHIPIGVSYRESLEGLFKLFGPNNIDYIE